MLFICDLSNAWNVIVCAINSLARQESYLLNSSSLSNWLTLTFALNILLTVIFEQRLFLGLLLMCFLFLFSCKWENNDRSSLFAVCRFRLSFIITISYTQNHYYVAQKQMWWDEWVGGQEMRVWIIIREIEDRCSTRKVSASLKECGVTSQSLFVGDVPSTCVTSCQNPDADSNVADTSPCLLKLHKPTVFGCLCFWQPTHRETYLYHCQKEAFLQEDGSNAQLIFVGVVSGKKMNYTVLSPRAISCRHRRFVIYGSFLSARGFNVLGAAWWESWHIHRHSKWKHCSLRRLYFKDLSEQKKGNVLFSSKRFLQNA